MIEEIREEIYRLLVEEGKWLEWIQSACPTLKLTCKIIATVLRQRELCYEISFQDIYVFIFWVFYPLHRTTVHI